MKDIQRINPSYAGNALCTVHAIMIDVKGIRTKICRSGLHVDLVKSSIYKDYPKCKLSEIKVMDKKESLIPWFER